MTEIEKMFENVGIRICKRKQGFTLKDCTDRECKKCGYYNIPLFTAEKQIGLIKFLLKNYDGVDINKKNNRFNFLVDNDTFIGCHHNDKSFEESLAGVINKLWQDLTDQEKEEIRNILK